MSLVTRSRSLPRRAWRWLDGAAQPRVRLGGLLLLAALPRFALALLASNAFSLRTDSRAYLALAQNWLQTGVFGQVSGLPDATIPPGYPFFLAALFRFTGDNLLAVRLAQAALGLGVVWLVWLIGRRAFSPRVGWLAGIFAALYPPLLLYGAFIMTETLYTFFLLFFVYHFLGLLQEPGPQAALLAGAGFALSLLTRETLLLLPLAIPLLLWWGGLGWRQGARATLLFAGGALLLVSPWLLRNRLTFGHLFFTGRSELLRAEVTGSGYLPAPQAAQLEERQQPLQATERHYAYLQWYGQPSEMRDPRFALAQPGRYATLLYRRAVEFWLHPLGLESLPAILLPRLLYVAGQAVLLALGLAQLARLWRCRHRAAALFAALLFYITIIGLFLRRPLPRYTLPFTPLLLLLAAGMLLWLGERRRQRRGEERRP